MAVATVYAIRDLQDNLGLSLPIPVDTAMVVSQTRTLLLQHQVTQDPVLGPADVIGGFDLTRQSALIAPAPDWRSAYGVSLLATILKDGALRPRLAESVGLSQTELLLRGALAARFLVQLSFKPEEVDTAGAAIAAAGAVTFSQRDVHSSGITIADRGQIGSASDADSIAIAANGVVTFSQAPVFPDGSIALVDLDIDGGTDIGADLATTDLIIVDDGAGGTNRKAALSRVVTLTESSATALAIALG